MVTLGCVSIIIFEFWNYPPLKVIDVSRVPAAYYWIKGQPGDFTIAEYPLDIEGPNELYKFFQTIHQKKIINGTTPGTYAHQVAQSATRLSEHTTTGLLRQMGVKFVLVHREKYLNSGLTSEEEELAMISRNADLRLIKSFPLQECPTKEIMCVAKSGPVDVYELITPKVALAKTIQ